MDITLSILFGIVYLIGVYTATKWTVSTLMDAYEYYSNRRKLEKILLQLNREELERRLDESERRLEE